ncbi:MAG TPA: 4a-hydroxytetrahydrobiopterin dehydratase [Mycobacteriales bacterium]|jgi:4a-hydroxytetrahydrobiopterin dehydratase|nr:4a-hydroxytetrahydrobiopterin dehydratase [Mycobacteriales bacterium]
MTRDPLTDAEVAAAGLDGWAHEDGRLRRTVTAASFPEAIALVNTVAAVAEELDHHPDMDVRYRDVTFACWTHTAGGVTEYDVALARRIDELAGA